jgi:uroporphyrinogen decarboxylase
MTSKAERFIRAARGEAVDRPPVGAWVHFGSALWDPGLVADVHVRQYRAYDFDYIKVMSDYRFPTAGGITEAHCADDLLAVGDADLRYDNIEKQADVLRRIRAAAPDAAIVDTVFSPFQTVVRTLGESAAPLLKANPGIAHRVLRQVTDRLLQAVHASEDLADAIFFSVNGATRDAANLDFTEEQFAELVAPYDREVLGAAAGRIRILHAHGYDLIPEWFDGFPAEVLSWSHHQTKPSVEDVAAGGTYVPLGGLDELNSLYWPPSAVTDAVLATRRATGDRIILGPGCTVHSDTSPSVLRAFVEAARLPL